MLTPLDIDAALNAPQYSTEKSKSRERIDQHINDFSNGQGTLATIAGGAMAIPAALSTIKMKEIPTREIPL